MKGASGWDNPSVGRVYDQKGLSPTLNSCTGGGRQPYIIVRCDSEKRIPIAIRGRNPENPSDRTPGIPTVQRIEPQQENICNTLTTVNKDTMILEIAEDPVKPIRGGENPEVRSVRRRTSREFSI